MNRRPRRTRNHLHKPRRRWGIYKWILIACVLTFVYFAARISMNWNASNGTDTARVSLTITPGESFPSIVTKLDEAGLIKDSFVFGIYTKWYELDTKLQAGDYVIQRNLNYEEILEVLQNGKSDEMKVTIPEGYTIEQIDALLAKLTLIEAGELSECARSCALGIPVDSLEGYMFPSTYYVNPQQFTPAGFLQRLYRTFDQQISGFKSDITASGRTLDEVVNVAAMVEREASVDAEMPIIAGIIWKRLDERMHLGIDATTRYEKNDWVGPLYAADFETDSPYNTRRSLGLPPTAISNPGYKALEATVYPEETEYYYYLHDPKGQIHYGVTLEDHNNNKNLYLR